jgi:hypothetical protein
MLNFSSSSSAAFIQQESLHSPLPPTQQQQEHLSSSAAQCCFSIALTRRGMCRWGGFGILKWIHFPIFRLPSQISVH